MAEPRRFALTPQLDIEQILMEAQHRWLRPAEICEILRNYQKFCIAPEPPNKPPSGSLFLFDRKVLRYFRKDGHNWRKKKDGKTVKEAHERLKAGSVDVLHCYYAHGEENENFQRRSYWMLEEDLMHIVLVHYREVQGKHNNYGRTRNPDETSQVVCDEGTAGSNSLTNHDQMASRTTTGDSPSSAQTSEYEDADHDNYQASSRYHPFVEMPRRNDNSLMDIAFQNHYFPVSSQNSQGDSQSLGAMFAGSELYAVAQDDITKAFDESVLGLSFSQTRAQTDLPSWDEVLGCTADFQNTFPAVMESVPKSKTVTFSEVSTDEIGAERNDTANTQGTEDLQLPDDGGGSLAMPDMSTRSLPFKEGNAKYTSLLKQLSLDISNGEGDQGLKKYDSFSRWMSKELGEVNDSQMRSSTGIYWDAVENDTVAEHSGMSHQDQLDSYVLSPSLSQDQLFSIIDFSPTWAYTGLETKVLITGTFLENKNGNDTHKWSCMFGEIEVPAEVLADGILRCYAPPHKAGRVPFYVTCSNRLACSEVREFEYVVSNSEHMETSEVVTGISNEILLQIRLEKILSMVSPGYQQSVTVDKASICNKISSLLEETDDELSDMLKKTTNDGFFLDKAKDEVLQILLKAKLRAWLLCKVAEDGKGPNILDNEGQGVIHLAAALGYDWAVAPIVAAGVSINFRDASGWTALHWAASCGRERTVVALVSLGAASGALTDPTPKFPNGRTPADLASSNGHKGIAGFLAESSLTTHLSTLTLKESGLSDVAGISTVKSIEHIVERDMTVFDDEYLQTGQSMKDSLSAVRNAAQAAARIHQVFRVQSFHRKKLAEYGDTEFGLSDEEALSLVAIKSQKGSKHDEPVHAAAIRIQNKFRGWKGRKEFLITRQRIVRIQAHVRGHQVRKHLRKICWSVGIMEKVILRWRRKGTGLRGFRSEALIEGSSMPKQPSEEEDYDFLKEGRKQTEARLEKALARVKSMVQYPEARDQYRRLLTGVEEFKESKVMVESILHESEETTDGDIMFDIEELLGEDAPMSPA